MTLSKVGINIVGRSHRLRINYRTTQQILHWATALLNGVEADDLDGGHDDLVGYRSLLSGGPPQLVGCDSSADENRQLVAWIEDLSGRGFEHDEIAIAARTRDTCARVEAALSRAGLAVRVLEGDDDGPSSAISVASMHRLKGLEFRAMAIVDCSRGSMPLPGAMAPANVDPNEHVRSLQAERSLLFVACTRAREVLRVSWSGTPSEFITERGGTNR